MLLRGIWEAKMKQIEYLAWAVWCWRSGVSLDWSSEDVPRHLSAISLNVSFPSYPKLTYHV